ncbi:hypothetical protein [Blastococcus atacamensis]|uniref:hypothetical protein n=1 Tax=Blastococcus atacamensis TaxID=2070508 RepID=UPI0012FFE87D|nr:hypothetical protein [Blastococcus atacamensis]
MRRSRRAGALALLVLASSVACSSDPVDRVPPVAGTGDDDLADHVIEAPGGGPTALPDGTPLFREAPPVAWADGGEHLAVIIGGSSSCPRGPGSLEVTEPQRLVIDVVELRPGQEACSADDSPYVTIVEAPDGLDATRPVTAVLDWGSASSDDTTVTLAPLD